MGDLTFMLTITLKDIPTRLHRELKARARSHGRSLNREIIQSLESSVYSQPVDAEQLFRDILIVREKITGYLTDEDLKRFKSEGRP